MWGVACLDALREGDSFEEETLRAEQGRLATHGPFSWGSFPSPFVLEWQRAEWDDAACAPLISLLDQLLSLRSSFTPPDAPTPTAGQRCRAVYAQRASNGATPRAVSTPRRAINRDVTPRSATPTPRRGRASGGYSPQLPPARLASPPRRLASPTRRLTSPPRRPETRMLPHTPPRVPATRSSRAR